MKVKLGIVGFGEFSESFLEIFKAHPDIDYVVGCEIVEKRRKHIEETYNIKMYSSFDEMLENDGEINSIAIFSQRHQHGPMAIKALKSGKNVFSAVPMGCTEDEVFEILRIVKETHLTYMMAETCYYFPCVIFCRNKFSEGGFGDVVYAEAQYYHDITEMCGSFSGTGNPNWKRIAGIPPMFYATHSMSMVLSSINDYPTEITCFGYEDRENDGIYGKGCNDWDNPFSNETAILKMSKGALVRINEFRRVSTVKPSSYITGIYGTTGMYECSGMQHLYCRAGFKGTERKAENVSDMINSLNYINMQKQGGAAEDGLLEYTYHRGFSNVHPTDRLPEPLRELGSVIRSPSTDGHNGSHPFLVDDFVRAVVTGKLPPNNAWDAAHYTLAGIIAHESAMQGGKTIKMPEVGYPDSSCVPLYPKGEISK